MVTTLLGVAPASASAAPAPTKLDPRNQVLTVSPVIVRAELKKDGQASRELVVANQTGRPVTVTIGVASLRAGSEKGGLDTLVEPDKAPLGIQIVASPTKLTMKPGEEQRIKLAISAEGARAGGYSAAVLVVAEPQSAKTLSIRTQIEVVAVINVAGKANEDLQVTIEGTGPLWVRKAQRRPLVALENNGDVHERVDIAISDSRLIGADARYQLRDVTLLRDAKRKLPFRLDRGGLPDLARVEVLARAHSTKKGATAPIRASEKRTIVILPLWFVLSLTALVLVLIWRIRKQS